jgi:hypothetical protein
MLFLSSQTHKHNIIIVIIISLSTNTHIMSIAMCGNHGIYYTFVQNVKSSLYNSKDFVAKLLKE